MGGGNRCLKGKPSHFCKMKRVLEMDGSDNVNVLNATEWALITSYSSNFDIVSDIF